MTLVGQGGVGQGRITLLAADNALRVSIPSKDVAVAKFGPNALAGRKYLLTLQSGFSCYGPERFGVWRIAFTITAANIPRRMDFHTDFGDSGRLTVVAPRGLTNRRFTVIRGDSRLALNGQGELRLLEGAAEITLSAPASFVFGVYASNMLGTATVTAHVYGGCPKPADYALVRQGSASYRDLGVSLRVATGNGELVRVCELLQQGRIPIGKLPSGPDHLTEPPFFSTSPRQRAFLFSSARRLITPTEGWKTRRFTAPSAGQSMRLSAC